MCIYNLPTTAIACPLFSRVWKTPPNYTNYTNGLGIHTPALSTLWITSHVEGGSSTAWLTGDEWPCQKNSWKSNNSFINGNEKNIKLLIYMQIYCVLRISRAWFTRTVCAPCNVSKFTNIFNTTSMSQLVLSKVNNMQETWQKSSLLC